jgi:pyruvate formate lyase activating enzyme
MKEVAKTNDRGVIFNIQRFSIHDGPGIRTTVFMKGCPLRCRWCANPESQERTPQLMVRFDLCRGCHRCAAVCATSAISYSEEGTVAIEWDACVQCFRCVRECTAGALETIGRYASVEEIVSEVEKDRVFHINSGGGVTISGGEPLYQFAFLLRVLRGLKEKGFHLALETSGFAPEGQFREILPYCDLVLFDIKSVDLKRHKAFTGVNNDRIMENARMVAGMVKTWFRIPLISGVTDSVEDLWLIAHMAKEWGVEKISLLPYHDGGIWKSRQVGHLYDNDRFLAPPDDVILRVQGMISQWGILCTVGQ